MSYSTITNLQLAQKLWWARVISPVLLQAICLFCFPSIYIWAVGQTLGQDDWILVKFFFACLWTKTERNPSTHTREKATWSISSHLDLISFVVNKGFIKWDKEDPKKFFCGTQHVIPSRQDSALLLAWVANQSTGFCLSCLLTEPAIQ